MNYKIIVVEDELPILNNIVRKLNNLDLPLTVVATATNGEDALELVHKHRPHLLITDIHMPGMDGLTLCKTLYKQYPEIKLVILSGYDEFSYAQKAIHYQVADYLLKPVNLTRLRETMSGLCALLKKEEFSIQEKHLFLSVSGQTAPNNFPCSFGEKPLGVTLICIGNLLNIPPENVDLTFYNDIWKLLNLENFLNDYIDNGNQFWILPEKRPNECFLITSFFDESLPKALAAHAESLFCDKIHINFCTMPDGIPYQDIWKAAQQERIHLRSHLVPCHSNIYIEGNEQQTPLISTKNMIALVVSSIHNRQQSAYQTEVSRLLDTLKTANCPQRVLENTFETIVKSLQEHNTLADTLYFSKLNNAMLSEICLQNRYHSLYRYLNLLLNDAFNQVFHDTISKDSLATTVKKYLDENFKKNITMDSLVEIFHFSDSYIGRIFRNEFGTPPMKYLIALRIEEACRLMETNKDLGIALIGEMVGYNDQRYFSRIFHSIKGVTPSQYKKNLSS